MHLRRICIVVCAVGVAIIAGRLAFASTVGPNVGIATSPTRNIGSP